MLASLALAVALQLAPRPTNVVPSGQEAAYAEFLRVQAIYSDWERSGVRCDEAVISDISTEPLDAPGVQAIFERVRLEGCGRSSIQNIDVGYFGGSTPWKIRARLPGDTRFPVHLQEDFLIDAISSAGAGLVDGCSPALIKDIYVAANPGHVDFGAASNSDEGGEPRVSIDFGPTYDLSEVDRSKAWAEIWRLNICGEDRTIMIVFGPTNDGQLRPMFVPVWRSVKEEDLPQRVAPAP